MLYFLIVINSRCSFSKWFHQSPMIDLLYDSLTKTIDRCVADMFGWDVQSRTSVIPNSNVTKYRRVLFNRAREKKTTIINKIFTKFKLSCGLNWLWPVSSSRHHRHTVVYGRMDKKRWREKVHRPFEVNPVIDPNCKQAAAAVHRRCRLPCARAALVNRIKTRIWGNPPPVRR